MFINRIIFMVGFIEKDKNIKDEEIDWDDLYPAEGLDADELDLDSMG